MKKILVQIDGIKLLEKAAIVAPWVLLDGKDMNEKNFEMNIERDRILGIKNDVLEQLVENRAISFLKRKYGIVNYIKGEKWHDVDIDDFEGLNNKDKINSIYEMGNDCIKVEYVNGREELYKNIHGTYAFQYKLSSY